MTVLALDLTNAENIKADTPMPNASPPRMATLRRMASKLAHL